MSRSTVKHLPVAARVDGVAVRPRRAEVHGARPTPFSARQADAEERRTEARARRGPRCEWMKSRDPQAPSARRPAGRPRTRRRGRRSGCEIHQTPSAPGEHEAAPSAADLDARHVRGRRRRRPRGSGTRRPAAGPPSSTERRHEEDPVWPATRAAVMSVPGTSPPNSTVRVCFVDASSASVQTRVARCRPACRGRSPRASPRPRARSPARLRSASSDARPLTANASAGYGAGCTMRQGASPVRWNSSGLALARQRQLRQPVLGQVPVEFALAAAARPSRASCARRAR